MRNIVVLLCIFGLFLFGCAQLTTTTPQTQQVQYVCADGITTVANISLCPPVTLAPTIRTLTVEEELSICIDMPSTQSGSFEDVCYMMIAAKHENTSLCRKVSTTMRSQCYTTLAEVKEDATVCAEAGTYKDSCYQQYAQTSSDSSVCEKITDVDSRDRCYSSMASGKSTDPTLCEKIKTSYMKDDCYSNAASRTRDITYCNMITDSSRKENCLQNIQGQTGIAVPK